MIFKKFATVFFVVFLSLNGTEIRSAGQSQTQQGSQNQVIEICAVSNVPGGYVIVGKTTSDNCRANADLPEKDNALLIKKPGPREIICERTPYPGNYAVVAKTRSAACPRNSEETYNNAWVIERMK
jgi:hypothetical protein